MRLLEVFRLFVISFSPMFCIEQVIPPEEMGTQFSSVCFEKNRISVGIFDIFGVQKHRRCPLKVT
jgi:hypothetical protein